MDALTDAFGLAQQWLFEGLLQPLMFHLGLGNLLAEGYRATGWLLVGGIQIALMLTLMRALERWRPVEAITDRAAVRTDIVYTLIHRLGLVRVVLFLALDPLWNDLAAQARLAGLPAWSLDSLWPGVTDVAWVSFVIYLLLFDAVDYAIHRAQHLAHTRFLQLAEDISMVPMQQLWGRIFALEVATPGRFSIRALNTLKEMTQREAQLFQRICALSCHYEGSDEQRLLLGMHKGAGLLSRAKVTRMGLGKYRVPYSALLLLCDLGLMHRGELESGPLPADGVELAFGNQRWRLRQRQSNLTLLYYRLTPIGNELALLLEEPPLEEYLQDLKTLLSTNLQIETLMLAPAGDARSSIAMAFQELAGNAQKIGELNITPDLLRSLLK